jgi:hypothetical protein
MWSLSLVACCAAAASGSVAAAAAEKVVDFMSIPTGPNAPKLPVPPQPGPRGSNLLVVAHVDLETGNVTRAAPFYTNDTVNGYSCIQAFRPNPATYYIASSGGDPSAPLNLISVDVASGMAVSVSVSEQLVMFDISYAKGYIYAYAAAPPYAVPDDFGIFEIDPSALSTATPYLPEPPADCPPAS